MKEFDLSTFEAPLSVPSLTSGPVVLRPFAHTDLALIRAAAADPYIPSITSVPPIYSREEGVAFIGRQHARAAEGHGFSFVIADGTRPDVGLGSIGLWLREIESGRASVGYWLTGKARGRKLAGWALRGLVAFAFEELAVPRLHLFVEPWNTASVRTAESAGFGCEGLLRGWERVDGQQKDAYCYVLLAQEWPGRE